MGERLGQWIGNRWVRYVGQAAILGLVTYFWGRSLWNGWRQVSTYHWQFGAGFLAASLVALIVHVIALALIWQQTLACLGLRRPWGETTRIWALSQVARYLPGGVWDVAGRLVLSSQAGYSRTVVSASILLEMVLQALAAIVVFLLSLPLWQEPMVARVGVFSVLLIPVGLCVLHPKLLNAILRQAARLTKSEYTPLPLRYRDLFWLLLAHVGARALIGSGFYFFVLAVHPWSIGGWPIAIGIFSAAWVAGYLVFFIPMGLGVREGVMTFLLGAFLPVVPASIVAIGFRLWIALRDVAFAGLGWVLKGRTEAGAARSLER